MEHEGIGLLYAKQRVSWGQAAWHIIKRRQDTDDIVHQAVYQTIRSNAQFKAPQIAEYYVLKALRTTAIDHMQARSRLRLVRLSPSDAEEIESREPDPEAALLAKEQQERFQAALASLSADQRSIITLFMQAESARPLAAISRQTGIPLSTLRSRILAGLKTIKERIGGDV